MTVASPGPMAYTRWPMRARFKVQGLLSLLLQCVVLLAALTGLATAADPALAEQDLAELRERLEQIEKNLADKAKSRDRAQRDLRAAEKNAAGVRRKLAGIEKELQDTNQRIGTLESRAAELRTSLATQVSGLEAELRRAYILGQDDWLRAVLSEQDPVEVGRQLVYSSYLARERNELAMAMRADLADLDETRSALTTERQRLAAIRDREQARLDELAELRSQRSASLAAINRDMSAASTKLERTRQEIAELQSLVDELTQALLDIPVADAVPFGETRGRLGWPVAGRVVQSFGRPRADGRLRWDGVLLAAGAGTEVMAVHHGRVVYADWLQGMGLLVIIEHGDGYLSLYGHNQDIVAAVGEWVTPGTVIAHVGDSGGQTVAGLYFEIRKNGKPVDPAGWVKR